MLNLAPTSGCLCNTERCVCKASARRAFFKRANLMAEQKAGVLGVCEFFCWNYFGFWSCFFPFSFIMTKSHSLMEFQRKPGMKMAHCS